ncbi:MAG: signal peptidase I [Armatimonadota bacterium]|nr:signal peptidase I [Armatimonadota bacterium]
MSLHIDSWPWKIALVLALIAMREFVRLLSPQEAGGRRGETQQAIIETLDSAAIALGLVLFIIQPFLLQAFYIPSGSMEDTLRKHDRLLVSKLIYRLREPRVQDVVVFRAPPEVVSATNPEAAEETDFIKRCMGTPGDVLQMDGRTRQLSINGKPAGNPVTGKPTESYVKWSPSTEGVFYSYDMKIVDGKVYSREYVQPGVPGVWRGNGVYEPDQERITQAKPEAVPPGKLLMLGDHRNNSNDSHAWGLLDRSRVVGKAIAVFWPHNRLGLLDNMSFHPRPAEKKTPAVSVPQY